MIISPVIFHQPHNPFTKECCNRCHGLSFSSFEKTCVSVHGPVAECVQDQISSFYIVRRHKRHPLHQKVSTLSSCFYRSRTIKRIEEERHIALYQKTIVVALWAKSEIMPRDTRLFRSPPTVLLIYPKAWRLTPRATKKSLIQA